MSELINNRAHRIQTLKEIIKHLHRSGSPDEVRAHLRHMVHETDASEIAAMEQEPIVLDSTAPAWFDEAKIALTIDADELLAAGQVPLPRVQQAVREIPPGGLLRVKSAFRPAPLLEALHKSGHRTYVIQPSPEAFHTYVCSKISA
jgi:hypothetical protein